LYRLLMSRKNLMICCLSPEMLLETTGLGSTFSIGTLPIVRVARRPFMAN